VANSVEAATDAEAASHADTAAREEGACATHAAARPHEDADCRVSAPPHSATHRRQAFIAPASSGVDRYPAAGTCRPAASSSRAVAAGVATINCHSSFARSITNTTARLAAASLAQASCAAASIALASLATITDTASSSAVAAQPATCKPITTEPDPSLALAAKPASPEPAAAEPASTVAITAQPPTTGPAPSRAVAAESTAAEPTAALAFASRATTTTNMSVPHLEYCTLRFREILSPCHVAVIDVIWAFANLWHNMYATLCHAISALSGAEGHLLADLCGSRSVLRCSYEGTNTSRDASSCWASTDRYRLVSAGAGLGDHCNADADCCGTYSCAIDEPTYPNFCFDD